MLAHCLPVKREAQKYFPAGAAVIREIVAR